MRLPTPHPRALGLGATVLLIAAVPAPASQAAGWSPPVTLSSPATFIGRPDVTFGPRGDAVAAWSYTNGIGDGRDTGVRGAIRPPGGSFGAERDLPSWGLRYGRSRYAALSVTGDDTATTLRVTLGSIGGSAGTYTIGCHRSFRGRAALAVNDRGRVAVAYVALARDGRRAVKLAERRAGGRFGSSRVVDRTGRGAFDVAVAVGPGGEVVVAWQRGRFLEARVRPRRGRMGPVERLGPAVASATDIRAAIARDGAAWVQWDGAPASEGGRGPRSVRVATRPARAKRFRRALLLDADAAWLNYEDRIDLAVDPAGTGYVAWTGSAGGRTRARLATIPPSGRSPRVRTLSGPDGDVAVGDLATGPRAGQAIVVWARLDAVGEIGTQIFAGEIAADGSYAGEEAVSDADRARDPAVALDPVTAAPTVVWSQRIGPDGPGVPIGEVRTVARASTRALEP